MVPPRCRTGQGRGSLTDVAALIADMVRAGVDPDLIGRTAAALAGAAVNTPAPRTARQERNRRYYERKASEKRLNKTDQDVSDASAVSSPQVSPHTPLPNPSIHNPPSPPKGGSSPAGFDQFWAIYPNRVGKRDAEKAFTKATGRASLETILAGLRRYVAKTDDRPWCNPATWLNQDRWEDAPATVQRVTNQQQQTKPRTMGDLFRDEARRFENESNHPAGYLDAGHSAADGSGFGELVQFARPRIR